MVCPPLYQSEHQFDSRKRCLLIVGAVGYKRTRLQKLVD
jgi:hypothetical protein